MGKESEMFHSLKPMGEVTLLKRIRQTWRWGELVSGGGDESDFRHF